MNPWRWVDPRIEAVRLADLRAYFAGRGWKLVSHTNPNLLRFEAPVTGGGPSFFQMVPRPRSSPTSGSASRNW